VLAVVAFYLRRWLRRRLGNEVAETRFSRALSALIILALYAVAPAALVAAVVAVLDSHGLVPPRVAEVGFGLVVAVAIASFGRGVAIGLFAPDKPDRRLLRCD
jgi:potassium-dependent mechanosensitive channel